MTLKNKKTLLIVFISVLTLINISAIVTFFYHSHNSHTRRSNYNKNCNKNFKQKNKSCLFVKETLQLNDAQFEKYNKLKTENRNKTKQYIKNIRYYKQLIISELANIETDSLLLSEYADSIGVQNKLLQLEMNQHFLKLKSILKNNQLVKFKKLLKRMEGRKRHNHKNKRKSCG